MKYTVVTTPVADHQLAEIWMSAADRQLVANTFDRIETMLKCDAHLQGRFHPDGWRVLSLPPLAVTFRVSEEDRLAKILAVYTRS